ncbi:MAG: histidine phosphatase family protein [Candidatus Deferrimicrobiaceae bacterium]
MDERRPDIWIVRHGETDWSRTGRHTGRTDTPLTAAGEREAMALGKRFDGRTFALVLSSPLSRAWETCCIVGYGDVARAEDDLREWDYGVYEGRTTAEIQRETPGWTIWDGEVPGGEMAAEVGRRADRVIRQATEAGGDVALFAHGHILRVLAARWLGLGPTEGRLFALGTSSIGVLGYEREVRVIRAWNLTAETGP